VLFVTVSLEQDCFWFLVFLFLLLLLLLLLLFMLLITVMTTTKEHAPVVLGLRRFDGTKWSELRAATTSATLS
jgi:hypothetical protein